MSAEDPRSHLIATPFQPFNVHTIEGRSIPVKNRDFILITPTGRHTDIFQRDDSRTVLDVELINDVDFASPTGSQPASKMNP